MRCWSWKGLSIYLLVHVDYYIVPSSRHCVLSGKGVLELSVVCGLVLCSELWTACESSLAAARDPPLQMRLRDEASQEDKFQGDILK